MDVRLPKLGENAEGGTVVSILVKEGDTVSEGQTILELENEKAVAPIPSTGSGVVARLRVKEGDRLTVGQVILTIEASGPAPKAAPTTAPRSASGPARPTVPAATAAPLPPAPAAPGSAEAPLDEPAPDAPMPPASPDVRRTARLLELDLRRVPPASPGGRVEWSDLRDYIQRLQRLAAAPRPTAAAPVAPGAKPIPAPEPIDFAKWGPVTRQPLTVLRKTISRRMSESWHAVPRVTQFDEADITDLMALRKKFAAEYEKQGARLTLTSFALRAAALALRRHPILNSSLDPARDELVLKDYIHIGLAVDTEQGLLVPVVRDADKKSLLDLSKDVQLLADKARDRKVSLDEMKGGTFTISNQGGIGGGHFTPIINAPEVAILGLGKGALKPAVRDGKLEARMLLPLTVAYDHRVIDGGTAARFTVDLVAAFQSFTEADVAL